jgi:hypothetical protein
MPCPEATQPTRRHFLQPQRSCNKAQSRLAHAPHLQQGVEQTLSTGVLNKTYPTKEKDSKGMLALGNQGTGIQESKFLLQKSLLK